MQRQGVVKVGRDKQQEQKRDVGGAGLAVKRLGGSRRVPSAAAADMNVEEGSELSSTQGFPSQSIFTPAGQSPPSIAPPAQAVSQPVTAAEVEEAGSVEPPAQELRNLELALGDKKKVPPPSSPITVSFSPQVHGQFSYSLP